MYEVRSIIDDIDTMKEKARSVGANLRDHYLFCDTLFVPKDCAIDLNIHTVRLRVSKVSGQPTKKAVVTEKMTLWNETSKTSRLISYDAFDSEKEAALFIQITYYDSLKIGLKYLREGWKYRLDECHLFIEDIKIPGFPPTIEIEAKTEEELRVCREQLGIREISFYSVPEMVRQWLRMKS